MESFDILIAAVAVLLVVVATARRDPQVKAVLTPKTMWRVALYLVHCLVVVLIVYLALRTAPPGALNVVAGSAFIAGWIGIALLVLIRDVPALNQAPAMLRKPFGPLGLGLLALAAAGSAMLYLKV